jgi:hypothetical protein
VTETTCDILLYAGKWSPRIRRSLEESLAHAVRGASRLEISASDRDGDEPRVTVTVTFPHGNSELVRDEIHEDVLYDLGPQYESQVEVAIVHEREDDPYRTRLFYEEPVVTLF